MKNERGGAFLLCNFCNQRFLLFKKVDFFFFFVVCTGGDDITIFKEAGISGILQREVLSGGLGRFLVRKGWKKTQKYFNIGIQIN